MRKVYPKRDYPDQCPYCPAHRSTYEGSWGHHISGHERALYTTTPDERAASMRKRARTIGKEGLREVYAKSRITMGEEGIAASAAKRLATMTANGQWEENGRKISAAKLNRGNQGPVDRVAEGGFYLTETDAGVLYGLFEEPTLKAMKQRRGDYGKSAHCARKHGAPRPEDFKGFYFYGFVRLPYLIERRFREKCLAEGYKVVGEHVYGIDKGTAAVWMSQIVEGYSMEART